VEGWKVNLVVKTCLTKRGEKACDDEDSNPEQAKASLNRP